jgi:Mg-chelatase subunit ChlD
VTLAFALPQALWLLLALPLIILLHMLRARRVPHTVSSTLLWERTARDLAARLPVRRIERSLLLLLQLLAVAALALALARPLVQVPGVAGAGIVLVFDVSLSMQARDVVSMQARDGAAATGTMTRFAAAQAEARRLVEQTARGVSVMIVEAGASPRLVLDFSSEPAAVRRAIQRLQPADGRADVEGAVRVATAQRLRGQPVQVIVYTDAPGAPLPRVTYQTFGAATSNLALVRATTSTSGGGQTQLLAEVRNFGRALQRVPLRVTWPDGSAQRELVEVPAGDAVTRIWPARGDGPAYVDLQTDDALPADNHAVALVGRAIRPRVLLVSPGNPFLEAALAVLPVEQVRRAATAAPATWGAFDLVILDRVVTPRVPPGRYLIVGTVPPGLPVSTAGTARDVSVLRTDGAHPLLRLLDLTGVRVEEALVLRPRGGTVLAEGTVPLIWAIERPDLRAVLLPFDLQRSDLPLHPTFPLLMANTLNWLAPVPRVEAGQTLVLPAPGGAPAQLIDPAKRVAAVEVRGGALILPRLEHAGLYTLRTAAGDRQFAVTAASGESDLRMVPRPAGRVGTAGDRRQTELWSFLLLCGIGALLLEAALWLRAQPRLRPVPRLRRSLPALRLAVVGLLILALAGLEIARSGRDLAVVFAVDFSDSVSVAERQRALSLARAAVAARRSGDRFGLVTFGAEALVAESLSDTPRLAPAARPPAHRTDIGAAVRTALGVLPASGARRIVLLTDGQDTAGGAADAAALAAAGGVDIGVVPLGGAGGTDARVGAVQAPAEVRPGERFEVRVWAEAAAATRGTLRLSLGGREVWRGPVNLPEGRTLLRVPQQAAGPGTLSYEARLDVAPDELAENNRGYAVVTVVGTPALLYVAAQPGPLPRWLRAQGLGVRTIAPEALPAEATQLAGIPAVILDDVPATVLSPAQMRALRDYVSAMGGGLVTIGGPHAYGVGGYAGTDLEAALPLAMDVRHRVAVPSIAVVLVLDASGSMGSFGTDIAKVELAKEAAQAVVDLLAERDLIGVIAFDQRPHWLVRPTEAGRREQILEQVSRITAGGGTNLYPALVEAQRALGQAQAKVKHVIVLSDGQTDPGDFERLVTRMAREKITLSSVAIGNDADQEIMRDLARWGGGRYYFTRDLYTIPQIVTAEAVLATRAYLIEERFRPLVSPASPLLRGLSVPALRGYVATAPKPSATLHALTPQQDPLLASWQFGLGRVLAFTSDARPRWAAEWFDWPEAALLWSRLVRWTIAPPFSPLDVQTAVEGDQVKVVLEARDQTGTLLTDLLAVARIVGREGFTPLIQTAPGRYEGRRAADEPGGYLVTVEARRQGRLVGVGRAAAAVPYSPELTTAGVGFGALSRLVETAGARVMTTPAEMLVPPAAGGERRVPAWPPLAGAALGLFVAEITLRRLPVIREVAGRVAAAVLGWLRQSQPGPSAQDREYEAADQWRPQPEDLEASADMEQAARLYIARLRQQHGSDQPPRRD